VWILDVFVFYPFYKERKMVRNFLSVENSVDHVAAKKSHFDLVSSVWVDFVILVDGLKDVGGC